MDSFSIIVLILGIVAVVFPTQSFMFGRRWMFKEGSEPSKSVKYMGRAIGVIVIILALSGRFN